MDVEAEKVMKKKEKQLLILFLILILLCGIYAVLQMQGRKEPKETAGETEIGHSLLALDADSIQNLDYVFEGETLSFHKEGENWIYDQDETFPLNQSMMTQMAGIFTSLASDREVQDSLSNLSQFGLSQPQNTITVKTTDGSSCTLYTGNKNTITGGTYFYLEGDSHVYMTSSDLSGTFNRGLYDLMELKQLDSVKETTMYQVILERKDVSLELNQYKDGRPDLDYTGSFLWFVKGQDKEESIADQDAINSLKDAVLGLSFDRCVNYKASEEELSRYGFEQPAAKLTVRYTSEETKETGKNADPSESTAESGSTETVEKVLTLEIGGQTEDKTGYYVRTEDSATVNIMSTDVLEYFLTVVPADFANKYIGYIPITKISKAEVSCEGKSMIMEIKQKEDGSSLYYVNGEETAEDHFKSLYTKLLSIDGEKALTGTETITGEPEISITFTLTDNAYFPQVTLKFTPYDSNYYVVTENKTPRVLANKMDVASLKASLSDNLQ